MSYSACNAIDDCSGNGSTSDLNPLDGCTCDCDEWWSGSANCALPSGNTIGQNISEKGLIFKRYSFF